ncbi:tol-pal system protein YbgF [Rubellimicrobium sp. CFH 75288]|uniref:tol-pal system protein YbgF n=1 Tax=Rubellimicrobium sp. CFH 75288 TaxID=2697034 RepID=UPI0014127DFF|nr:tol-pal system protein YbgF [Rubellimicrobium sp. CFH 75288]NAZ36335.1 tol-pal system protein YbgF [Rubellimicrobium sp. CFH 75288]
MRRLASLLLIAWPVAVQAQADPQTLADIRAQVAALAGQIDGLRAELSASGALAAGVPGGTPLDRLNAIESELQRLTAKTEELEFRINRITADGTNRLGDIEFRLCEIEPGCDIANLGTTPSLGGVDNAAVVPLPEAAQPVAPTPLPDTGPDLAVSEQADFERAQEALANRDFRGAADGFAAFVQAYPGSPLTARAQMARGEALDALGETDNAARAYLDAFSADPSGALAADALLALGRNLGRLGQGADACVTLAEIEARFPASPLVAQARSERDSLGCP